MMASETNTKKAYFHRLAIELLQEILPYVTKYISRYGREGVNNSKLSLEVSRILASNLIIGHYLGLKLDEVNNNPELGLTQVSMNSQGLKSLISKVMKQVRLPRQPGVIREISKLASYELTKLLEAIHEVTVYGKVDSSSFENEVLQLGADEGNAEKRLQGVFYTPSEVTKFICENTLGRFLDERVGNVTSLLNEGKGAEIIRKLNEIFDLKLIDPACGPGSFLTESLMILKSRYATIAEIHGSLRESQITPKGEDKYARFLKDKNNFLQYFQGRIYGVDLDPAAIEVASICLSIISGRKQNLKFSLGLNLKRGNSLISEFPVGFVKPRREDVRALLNLRKRIRQCAVTAEKEGLMKIYEDKVSQLQDCQPVSGIRRASEFFESLREKRAFCWELEFPEVFYFENGKSPDGFEVLVMNPPYDLIKLNVSELKSKDKAEFRELKADRARENEYFRRSGHYRLSNTGMFNYYRLMIERALVLTSRSSTLGFIVPSTLLCDRSATDLRREILSHEIIGIFDFNECAQIFRGVNQAVCIVLLDKLHRGQVVPLASNLKDLSELGHAESTSIPLDKIKKMFPKDFAIPKVAEEGWAILEKIHRNPQISEIPWMQNLRGEVDLTIYKDCLSQVDTGNILVRGNHIARYVLRWNPKRKKSFILKDRFLRRLGNSKKVKHINEVRIAGQQVSNMMQRWRLKFCLVPPRTFLGNSCNYLVFSEQNENVKPLRFYMLSLLNSCLLNWRFKLSSTNNHINNYELGSLPIKLADYSSPLERELFRVIVKGIKRALQSKETTSVIPDIEAAVFLLYDLTPEEASFVLKSEGASQREIEDTMECFLELSGVVRNDY